MEEAEEDMELDDLPLLENVTPVPVPVPVVPGFVPFTVSTGQHCVPPKSLFWKVYHPYHSLVGVRATLPPSMLFADRALLHRGYSISDPNALVETVSKYKGLH